MQVDPMSILLLVLIAAGIWVLVELALTARRTRSSVIQLTRSANETFEQTQPVISKLDGVLDDLQPSAKRVDPLLTRANVLMDEVTIGLDKVNDILGDVSEVSGTAAGVSLAVGHVANNAASSVNGVIDRIKSKATPEASRIRGTAEGVPALGEASGQAKSQVSKAAKDSGYITYGETSAGEGTATANHASGEDTAE